MNSTPTEPYFLYWGKAKKDESESADYHLLPYHCLDVAAVGSILLRHDQLLLSKFTDALQLPEEIVHDLILWFLAMHDVGKFSIRFQHLKPKILLKLQGKTGTGPYSVRHDDMALILVEKDLLLRSHERNWFKFEDSGFFKDWKDLWRPWFHAVSGHHGVPPRRGTTDIIFEKLFDPEDRAAAMAFGEACSTFFFGELSTETMPSFSDELLDSFTRTSWLMAGLVVLSDWLGSNTDYFPECSENMPLDEYWNQYALPRAEKALKESGMMPSTISQKTGMDALFPDLTSPTGLQEVASSCSYDRVPNLFILEEMTGAGKTEAALVLAHRLLKSGVAEGIFIGLPTMATADAMYERLGKAYHRLFADGEIPSLVLAHSARHLSDMFRQSIGPAPDNALMQYGDGELPASVWCASWLSDSRKKALLASIGVGTIDQALMSILPFRHQSLRLLGLARSILIVDEVHAYDSYMHTLLCRLLTFHAAFGGSAILLSATLPMHQRKELIASFYKGIGFSTVPLRETAYPLLTAASVSGLIETPIPSDNRSRKNVKVDLTDLHHEVMDRILNVINQGQCACWIRNTVDDAILAFQQFAGLLGEENVMLFHARFAMGDRLTIEQEVLRKFGKNGNSDDRRGKLLIATQVVEQSLDLDFDFMASDLAPIDLLIQRAGRLHRHQRGDRGTPSLLVLAPRMTDTPDEGWYAQMFRGGAYVYPKHGQLWLTARFLEERGEIVLPDDARHCIESVFAPEAQTAIPEALAQRDLVADGQDMGNITIAHLNALNIDNGYKATPGNWEEETRTPTRLNALSVTITLARWDGEVLCPWSDTATYAWEMSQVNIRETKISRVADYQGALKQAVSEVLETMPGRGEGHILLPLTQSGTIWMGEAFDGRNREIRVQYDPRMGLQVYRERN